MADDPQCQAQDLFDGFVNAATCRATLGAFSQLCEHLQLRQTSQRPLYLAIKQRLRYWRADALWAKLDKRAGQEEYMRGGACADTTCVIVGAGPCGLRAAVELAFMGARVVLLEKRDVFSRNNVLHLWPFTIQDLRGLGAKKFYGRFCAGSIDHISVRQLQLVLLKVALLVGVEVHVNVEFLKLVEPEGPEEHKVRWSMDVHPQSHPVNQLQFDVIIGADGRRNTLPGFRRKEFRGKLAIGITANFQNRNTTAEAKVEEISGVAFIFNQRFFQELRQDTGIDLENIVYYKDDTHYFVMTAKKHSLLVKGVILQDHADTELLLSRGNVDQHALQAYARQAADFSTDRQLPCLDFALNHHGQPDVAMFDFTSMSASENAAMLRQRRGRQLLVTLVGDSLLEPFWPMGTGVARGFLAALDSAWMIRSWAQGGAPLDVLAERESLYRLLPQTTPENMNKNLRLYTVDPATRYATARPVLVTAAQVRHLVDTGGVAGEETRLGEGDDVIIHPPAPPLLPQDSSQANELLSWCQEQTRGYRGVTVSDLTTSWRSGLALCALIHHHRPDLMDFEALDQQAVEQNTRLGCDLAQQEFGISPLMTVEEMWSVGEEDSLSMVMYLSSFLQLCSSTGAQTPDVRSALLASSQHLSPEPGDLNGNHGNQALEQGLVGGANERDHQSQSPSAAAAGRRQNHGWQQQQMSFGLTQTMKSQTLPSRGQQSLFGGWSGCSSVCFFCDRRVYVMERLSAEGLFFHRSCFLCEACGCSLRPPAYVYDPPNGRFYCSQLCHLQPHAASHRKAGTSICSEPSVWRRTSTASLSLAPAASSSDALAGERRSSALQQEAELGLRQMRRRTSERMELENDDQSSGRPEVAVETLTHYNLSVQEEHSSEAEMEEELEEEEEGEEEEGEEEGDKGDNRDSDGESDEDDEGSSEVETSDEEEFPPPLPPPLERSDSTHSSHTHDEAQEPDSTSSCSTQSRPTPIDLTVLTSLQAPPTLDSCSSLCSPHTEEEEEAGSSLTPSHSDALLRALAPHSSSSSSSSWAPGGSRSAGPSRSPQRPPRRREQERSEAPHLLTPLQGSTFFHQLKSLRDAQGDAQLREGGGARALLKAVFPGTRRGGALSKGKKRAVRSEGAELQVRGHLTEEADLESSNTLQRCSLHCRTHPAYVPHALAFKRAYTIKRRSVREDRLGASVSCVSSCPTEVVGVLAEAREASSLSVREDAMFNPDAPTEPELDAAITRRVQRAARRQARQEVGGRLHRAQMIQKQLEQVEEKQKQLEERGVAVEKALRGEADYWGESNDCEEQELHLEGLGRVESGALMQQWFLLVQQKNALVRYESELLIFARELQLEDRQSRLQQELRERMAVDDHLKSEAELAEERVILEEMLEVVEQRDALVSQLEEQRVQEHQEGRVPDLRWA
ncbi:protein-methionine sulfoxide oxidase mical3b-like [Genypterus blacodes]|uniref:protein-methionine sulfoxide oxidase mical3b-like n=1 Tax=Genypterus blacodes TaxID=154954 RepID=UPI003F7666AC